MKEEFGYLPEVAVSLDAFGHSSITPHILDSLGYDGYVIYRINENMISEMNENS
jgi:hypothetical protein